MTGKHAAQHYEISTASKRLSDVARHSAAPVSTDTARKTVCGIGTFDDGGELRVPYARHLAGGADGPRTNAHLDDVSASKNKLFSHIAGDHVARHDDGIRTGFTRLFDEGDESFGIAVGDINAKILNCIFRTAAAYHQEFFPVSLSDAK